jgi:hypothetical protein
MATAGPREAIYHEDQNYICKFSDTTSLRHPSLHPVLYRWDIYAMLQETFCSRALTFETNVIRAFSGITSCFSRPEDSGDDFNIEIIYGHPVFLLRESLLWHSLGKPRKRSIPLQHNGLPTMPSWSWMAWKGKMRLIWSMASWLYGGDPGSPNFSRDLDTPTVVELQCRVCYRTHS